ncbi:MAG: OB-fold nucleic acid binding domain-containing protein, partial [Eubacteriales bacterium]|nr:OB-fold nucleic acid binding domain-containing protein [Eubacteriales bacterium]
MAEKQSNGNQKVSEQQVRREKLALLQEAGRDPFVQTKFTVTNFSTDITEHFDEMEGQIVTIAGRLMSKRGMGKVSFCDLQDKSGRIQIYARRDEMDEEAYNRFKKFDIG